MEKRVKETKDDCGWKLDDRLGLLAERGFSTQWEVKVVVVEGEVQRQWKLKLFVIIAIIKW